MKIIEGEECYSKEELFAEVRRRGLVISDSLFEEWQKFGVMSMGRREGRGRKKGGSGWWLRQQLELLCTLCRVKQEQKLASVAPQCNIPVWVWMYWGEGYGVSLEQVKRAIKTWVRRRYLARVKEVKASARQLVRLVANDQGMGRARRSTVWRSGYCLGMEVLKRWLIALPMSMIPSK